MSDTLEETFNLPKSEKDIMEDLSNKYKFSEDPNLKEIVKLALTAYKEQMTDIAMIEPKYRSRALEVANQFLNLAKDALSKNKDLEIKELKATPKEDVPKEDTGSIDRNAFMIHAVQNTKKGKA